MWRTEPLIPSQADTAAILYREFFPQAWERRWSAEEFVRLLATPGCFGHLLIDSADSAARGLILLRAAADEAEIITIGVVASHRRRGGAAKLLERATSHCVERGVHTLFLDVAEDNQPARRFYEARGFAIVGIRAAYYTRGATSPAAAVTMKASLTRDS